MKNVIGHTIERCILTVSNSELMCLDAKSISEVPEKMKNSLMKNI